MSTGSRRNKPVKGALSPVDAAAMQTALQLVVRGRTQDAVSILEGLAAGNPANAVAMFNLGKLYHKLGNLSAAEKYLRKALLLTPDDGQTIASLAFVHLARGDAREGLRLWERAKAHQLSGQSWATMGTFLRERGDLEQALFFFETAISLQPDCAEAYYFISRMRKFTAAELASLRSVAAKATGMDVEGRVQLEFALAKAYLDQGQVPEAFARYAEGNRVKRATRRVDISLYEKYADSIIRLFDEGTVEKLRGKSQVNSQRPLFVVGMMRSGSTLIDQILSSHPAVRSLGEVDYLDRCIPCFPNVEVPRLFPAGAPSWTQALINSLTPPELDKIGRAYLSLITTAAGGADRTVDKMLFNYLWVGLIRLALPGARIVHTTRDPMDTGLSLWMLAFAGHVPWAYDLEDIGRYILVHGKVMRHWKKIFPDDIYEANYEAMIADQEGETRRLLDFCGLPWDAQCLKFHETQRNVQTSSATQVRQPIYKDSVKRWKKYEEYLQPLIKTLGDAT